MHADGAAAAAAGSSKAGRVVRTQPFHTQPDGTAPTDTPYPTDGSVGRLTDRWGLDCVGLGRGCLNAARPPLPPLADKSNDQPQRHDFTLGSIRT